MRGVLFRLIWLAAVVLLTNVPIVATRAQQAADPAPAARVGFVEGNLAYRTRGDARWSSAGRNVALAAGGSLHTGANSRAELRLGAAVLDLAADTRLDIVALSGTNAEFALPQGQMRLRLRDGGANIAITLPRGAVRLRQPGEYEIAAGGMREPTRVAVFAGGARFTANGAALDVKGGEVALLSGANPVVARFEGIVADDFVAWGRAREQAEAPSAEAARAPAPISVREPPGAGSTTPPEVERVPRVHRELEPLHARRPEHERVHFHAFRFHRHFHHYAHAYRGVFNPLAPLFHLFGFGG